MGEFSCYVFKPHRGEGTSFKEIILYYHLKKRMSSKKMHLEYKPLSFGSNDFAVGPIPGYTKYDIANNQYINKAEMMASGATEEHPSPVSDHARKLSTR